VPAMRHAPIEGLKEPACHIEHRLDGSLVLRHPEEPEADGRPYPAVLLQQALALGDAVFLREADGSGWREFGYQQILAHSEGLARRLEDGGFSRGDVAMVFADNSVAHAVLMFAVAALGGALAPLAPQLIEQNPDQVAALARSLRAHWIASDRLPGGFRLAGATVLDLSRGLEGLGHAPPEAANAIESFRRRVEALGLHQTAKLLFTSGSTGRPKAVVNTFAMIASAQAIQAQLFRFVQSGADTERYAITDWLPWHHTYGGNSNFFGVLWAGGQLTIDSGRPVYGGFEGTIKALRDHPPTIFIGVPASIALLCDSLDADRDFAHAFFSRVRAVSSGGAALSAGVITRLQRLAMASTGQSLLIGGGYGMTETCAVITQIWWPGAAPETLGLPPPGVTLKLSPLGEDRYEARVRGANVTPGYLEADGTLNTLNLFDAEGFLRTGDALRFVDPADPLAGLAFAGRLTEEFKLANGAWVRVGQLRADLVDALGDLVRDAVIVGENREWAGALLWMREGKSQSEAIARLAAFNRGRSSTRSVRRAAALASPPDPDTGELAAKGSINQMRMRAHRIDEIEALYLSVDAQVRREDR
jgi:feruloyl-CoA synthase